MLKKVMLTCRLVLWISSIPTLAFVQQSVSFTSVAQSTNSQPDHLAIGLAFVSKHEWLDAEKQFRIYRNEHPDSVDAIVHHAEALIQISQPFDAALELQKFLQAHPDSTRALELHALLAESSLRDIPTAEADLEKCVGLDPRDFLAWKSLGDLYLDVGNVEQASRAYEAASKLHPQDLVLQASLVYARSGTSDKAQAEAGFEEAARMAQKPVEVVGVQMLYGRYLLDEGKKDEAIAAFGKVLAINPASVEALIWRAEAYVGLQQYTKAEVDALAALDKSPGDKRSALLLMKIYRHEGKTDEAQRYADMVQKLAAAEDAHYAMGRTLLTSLGEVEPLLIKGDYKEAAVRYETIVKTLPTFYEAYFDLGMCYSQMGRLKDAESAFRRYLSMQPASADGHASLGILLLAEGRGREAVPELREAIQIDPTLTEARKNLASEYLQEGNPKSAADVLRPAENEKDVQVLVLLAVALKQSSAYADALIAVNRALSLQPNDAQAIQIRQQLLSASTN